MGLEEKKQSKTIDGVTYEVTPLPFGMGRRTFVRVMKVLAPLLSAAFADAGPKAYANVFAALPEALSDEDLAYLSETFGGTTRFEVEGKSQQLTKVAQELHFAGRYLQYLQWLLFCLEVNYSSFFAGGASAQLGADVMAVLNKSPSTSAGTTG